MLNEIQFGYHMTRSGLHQVTARHGPAPVGGLQWHNEDDPDSNVSRGEIETVAVLPEYQGHGIATGMLDHARHVSHYDRDIPTPEHSTVRSPAGSAWAAKTGGHVPDADELPPMSPSKTRSLVRNMARS